ncbi:SPT2-domain-containing protein [Ascodesmis nigricans]|uniref:SPT2-domain-containing protein n=1 Tax=Ascodesmis nigricans TaxID=341454 RepID=A0A4S2N3U1_9PEZI|nr:SPT2-domain-containing protein [Ascodesmis nigricans]
MADSSSFSSILSKYRPTSVQPAPPATSVTPSISARPPPASRPSVTALKTGSAPPPSKTRPAPTASSTLALKNTQTTKPNPPTNGSTNRSTDPEGPNDQAPKRRKLETPAKPGPLTAAEKDMAERRKALLEKVKEKKETAVPKPSSYKEMLAKAAQIQAEKKNMVGVITHKARQAQDLKKLKPDPKPAKGTATPTNRNSKSPGAVTTDKTTKKGVDAKNGPVKRVTESARPNTTKDSALDRKKNIDAQALKRKRDLPISRAPVRKHPYNDRRRSRYDDDEDDDWIVDDDDDDPRGRGYGGYGRSRYRYAEDYDDDESDMEATGMDLLEEEERSRRAAIKEDQMEAKRLEEEAKRKAALKKAALKRK